jgi:DNA replication and repair protein RecF
VRIDTVATTHFRNLADAAVSLAEGINLFVGGNGQGKTNLLEAIYLFKFGRSFRAARETEMIRFGEAFCRVEASCTFRDGHKETFALAVERDGSKKTRISGCDLSRLSELVGRFPVVLFGPEDLRLVSGQPSERRRFLDMVGSMTSRAYLELVRQYRRILAQRGAALKARPTRAGDRDLMVWNTELVDKGCALILARKRLADAIEEHMDKRAREIGLSGGFSVRYDSEVLRESGFVTRDGGEIGMESMEEVFHSRLIALENEESRRGITLVGPHRDDFSLRMGEGDVRWFGSQGQRRLLAVLLKLAELSYLEEELSEPCVLLLDDVFSEFDRGIAEKLHHALEDGRQVLITSPIPVDWAAPAKTQAFSVSNGTVLKERGAASG